MVVRRAISQFFMVVKHRRRDLNPSLLYRGSPLPQKRHEAVPQRLILSIEKVRRKKKNRI